MQALTGHKRTRSDSAEDTRLELGDEEPDLALEDGHKRARRGWPATQWITVYNKRKPQKQRCAETPGGTPGANTLAAQLPAAKHARGLAATDGPDSAFISEELSSSTCLPDARSSEGALRTTLANAS